MDPTEIPLRDLHLPDEVGLWPLAPGWWILIALLVAGAAIVVWRIVVARRKSAPRRLALARLDHCAADYAEHGDPVRLGAELSELLRRTMLAYAPRSEVAGLTGDAWLEWLDRDLDTPEFTRGPGRMLVELPYRDPRGNADVGVEPLLDVVRRRLATPVAETA